MVADGRALSNYCYDCCALQRQLSERFFHPGVFTVEYVQCKTCSEGSITAGRDGATARTVNVVVRHMYQTHSL